MFNVGQATITRIEETNLPGYLLRDIFPDFTDAHLAEHQSWLAPHHYEAETGKIILSVHSWLLQVGGKKILIDSCCGNNKVKPGRPFWHMLNEPYLERLAAAGARPEEIDLVMCTHLHHDHVGWNTQQRDGKWVPTFPNARYVFSKPDVDYFTKVDADPKEGPAELGHIPRMRGSNSRTWESRSGERRAASAQRLHRDRFRARAFAGPCVLQAGKQRPARGLHRRRLASSSPGILSGLEFPEKFRRRAGARQPAQGARLLRVNRRTGFSGPCRTAVCRPCRRGCKRLQGPLSGLILKIRRPAQDFRPAPCGARRVRNPVEQHIEHPGVVRHRRAWRRVRPIGRPEHAFGRGLGQCPWRACRRRRSSAAPLSRLRKAPTSLTQVRPASTKFRSVRNPG